MKSPALLFLLIVTGRLSACTSSGVCGSSVPIPTSPSEVIRSTSVYEWLPTVVVELANSSAKSPPLDLDRIP